MALRPCRLPAGSAAGFGKIAIAFLIGVPVLAPMTAGHTQDIRGSAQSISRPAQSERALEPGRPIERGIASGETHHYQIAVEAAQYLRVGLDRQGLNLLMTLSAPDGKKLIEVTRASYQHGLIPLLFVAQAAGAYRLDVSLSTGETGPGRYRVSIEELRTATDQDRSRALAEWTFLEAQQLSEQGSAQSHRESIKKYEEALAAYRGLGDRSGEARALNFIGLAHSELGDQRKAIEHYTQSLPLYRALGESAGEASVLNNLGLAYSRLSDPTKAIECYKQAVPLRRAVGDRQGEAITLNNIGAAYSRLSEYRKALDHLDQALPIYRAIGHRRLEAGVLFNIGQTYASLGEWQKALERLTQSLPVSRSVGNRRLEANILVGLGAVYSSLNEHQRALNYYTQALPLHRESGNRVGEANTLTRIGRISRVSGETQQALDQFNQALAGFRAVGDRRGEAIALRDIGELHYLLNEKPKALDVLNQALPVARGAGHRDTEAGILNDIGVVYTSLSEHEKALDYLNQALDLYRSTGNRSNEVQALYNIAGAYQKRGDLAAAQSRSEESIQIAESLRGKVANPDARASYFSSVRRLYDLHIDILMQLNKQHPSKGFDSIALETSERARARSLLEMLVEAQAEIRQGVDRTLLDRERELSELLNAKAERRTQLLNGKHTPEQASAATREIESLLTESRHVQSRIRAASPRYAALTQPQPTGIKDIQRQALDPDTLMLHYTLGEDRSYLWVVSQASIASYELPKRMEIEEAARRFYTLLRRGGEERPRDAETRDGQLEEAARRLSRMLLSPPADRLESKRLVIIADGILHYIPFAALPDPSHGDDKNDPLIAGHEMVMLPSASVLAELRRELGGRRPAPRAVAVFADPVFGQDDPRLKRSTNASSAGSATQDLERAMRDVGVGGVAFPRLPFSRREAEAIVATAPRGQTVKAVDFEASRSRATEEDLSRYRVLHFATHGLLDSSHPELSGIVLSLFDSAGQPQDGYLRLHDIYNLKLPAELVVLSACQTALGKEIHGEGLVGLTRGFMYAGAARVVASLWKVDDAATAELMQRFYRGMLAKGMRPAAALREAQVEMWKQERWRSPYYWAAFVLQGEWR